MPKIEDAEWKPKRASGPGRGPAMSIRLLRSLKPGDVKRIVHDDVHCKLRGSCSLYNEIKRLRQIENWEIDQYHEDFHVTVVRRLK